MKGVSKNDKLIAYILIFLVVIIWGVAPPLNVVVNRGYSVALRLAIIGFISAIVLTFCCGKKLKQLNKSYFLIFL